MLFWWPLLYSDFTMRRCPDPYVHSRLSSASAFQPEPLKQSWTVSLCLPNVKYRHHVDYAFFSLFIYWIHCTLFYVCIYFIYFFKDPYSRGCGITVLYWMGHPCGLDTTTFLSWMVSSVILFFFLELPLIRRCHFSYPC